MWNNIQILQLQRAEFSALCIEKKQAQKVQIYGSEWNMNRIAVIGIIVEEPQEVEKLNQLLHEYGSYIIGRMGIPYRERKIHVISIAMDAPQDTINALTGKIGRLEGISAKAVYSK